MSGGHNQSSSAHHHKWNNVRSAPSWEMVKCLSNLEPSTKRCSWVPSRDNLELLPCFVSIKTVGVFLQFPSRNLRNLRMLVGPGYPMRPYQPSEGKNHPLLWWMFFFFLTPHSDVRLSLCQTGETQRRNFCLFVEWFLFCSDEHWRSHIAFRYASSYTQPQNGKCIQVCVQTTTEYQLPQTHTPF